MLSGIARSVPLVIMCSGDWITHGQYCLQVSNTFPDSPECPGYPDITPPCYSMSLSSCCSTQLYVKTCPEDLPVLPACWCTNVVVRRIPQYMYSQHASTQMYLSGGSRNTPNTLVHFMQRICQHVLYQITQHKNHICSNIFLDISTILR